MTEKVFFENKELSRNEIYRRLEDAFQCNIIFLPWDRNEILGHSDGIVHSAGGNRVLLTNYDDFSQSYYRKFRNILDTFFEVIPLKFSSSRKHLRSWAYINFLQLNHLILVPQLGIAEDAQALQQISNAFPDKKVVGIPSLEAVRKGGALKCISWNRLAK